MGSPPVCETPEQCAHFPVLYHHPVSSAPAVIACESVVKLERHFAGRFAVYGAVLPNSLLCKRGLELGLPIGVAWTYHQILHLLGTKAPRDVRSAA